MEKYLVIMATACSRKEAENIAGILVRKKLAACVNVVPKVFSVFRWQGKVSEENEVMLLIKSRESLFKDIVSTIKENHSYKVPEIIAFEIAAGSEDYLNWLKESTT